MEDQKKEYLPLHEVEGWEKNPRSMEEGDKERLKKQLVALGQYKPIIVTRDGDRVIVLGGNMRLEAIRELADEGEEDFQNVWVSFVDAPDERTRLEYALSDNDRAGTYDEKALGKMVSEVGDFPLEDYHFDTEASMDMSYALDRYKEGDGNGGEDEDERIQVLTIMPPESPNLKERVAIKFVLFSDYEKVRDAVLAGKIKASDLLKLV